MVVYLPPRGGLLYTVTNKLTRNLFAIQLDCSQWQIVQALTLQIWSGVSAVQAGLTSDNVVLFGVDEAEAEAEVEEYLMTKVGPGFRP